MFPQAAEPDAFGAPSFATPKITATVPVIRVRELGIRGDRGEWRISNATFAVRAGEIVGIAGVEGSGHHDLLQALAGVREPAAGVLELPSRVSFVPGDRHRDALILDAPLYENLALHGAGARTGLVDWSAVRARTKVVMDAFDVRGRSPRDRAGSLSGGNQQRFVLGRELDSDPQLLVAENPTRGLDLQATAAVHGRLRAAAAGGVAVIVHSADLDELLALAHRVLVVHAGTVQEIPPDRDRAWQAMVGAG
ncbi:MAG: hypothetical protein B7Z72_06210 [Gemmatimonadetes bacterium 21-71-4]|nr:MAG: hypothetical protein B7Z72_06210 [Gemmatimonadetes bacterium 21-71-4]